MAPLKLKQLPNPEPESIKSDDLPLEEIATAQKASWIEHRKVTNIAPREHRSLPHFSYPKASILTHESVSLPAVPVAIPDTVDVSKTVRKGLRNVARLLPAGRMVMGVACGYAMSYALLNVGITAALAVGTGIGVMNHVSHKRELAKKCDLKAVRRSHEMTGFGLMLGLILGVPV